MRRFLVHKLTSLLPPTRLYRFKRLIWRWAGLDVGPGVRIVSSARVWTSGPVLIGADTFIGHEVTIVGGEASVTIGARCDLAPRVLIVTGTHHDGGAARAAGPGRSHPVSIGEGSWIGAGATILDGVEIGVGAIVAAGSVVTRSIPDYDVVAGVPARRLRSRRADALAAPLTVPGTQAHSVP